MPSKRSGESGSVLLSNAVSTTFCGDGCSCCTRPTSATQTLEELDFLRSAGAAAQQGDINKLASILDKHPAALHEDGTSGAFLRACRSLQTRSSCHFRRLENNPYVANIWCSGAISSY